MLIELELEMRPVLGLGLSWVVWLSWRPEAGDKGLGSGDYLERKQMQ